MADILAEIVQQLENDPQSARIRKLLFYVCYNQWLTDSEQVANTDLSRMVKLVQKFFPTPAVLQEQLQQIVNQISKPAEYSQVADTILAHCKRLHSLSQPSSASISDDGSDPEGITHAQSNVSQSFLHNPTARKVLSPITLFHQQAEISQKFANHPQADRLKKLLYCLTHRTWESDRTKLKDADFTTLIDSLWRLYNTYDELKQTTESVVQRLTKPIEYGAIAALLLEEVAPLYGKISKPTPLVTILSTPTPTPPRFDDKFDLRQDIMKSINPLRLKILLVSLLDGLFDESDAAWKNLRKQSLDELVDRFMTHSKTLSLLTLKLRDLAQQLSPTADYEAVATTFLKVITPHFPAKSSSSLQTIDKFKPSTDREDHLDHTNFVANQVG
ncbi:MAG: hypothetical protein VKJ24_03535 [Synechococcales bacterium]|nr:hypothetical protein [Synechococcales bacterium]